MPRDNTEPIHKIGIATAILVAGILLAGILFIPIETLTGLKPSSQDNRIIWNTKNTTRFLGADSSELQTRISQSSFTGQKRPDSVIIVVGNDPLTAIAATSLIPYVNGPLFIISSWPNTKIAQELSRLNPSGQGDAAPLIVVGSNKNRVVGQVAFQGLPSEPITGSNALEIAIAIDEFKRDRLGGVTNNVVLAPENDFKLSLPVTSWLAHSGDSIFFVDDHVSDAVRSRVARRRNPNIYTVGGISGAIADDFRSRRTEVERITETGSQDIYRNAVLFAMYRDENAGFGWGLTNRRQNASSYRNFIFGNVNDWRGVSASSILARTGKFGATLLATESKIPLTVESFLWREKPGFFVAPNWGPFNHAYIIGDLPILDFLNVQGRVDWSQEISHYRLMGDGMSGLDMLATLWVIIGMLGAAWALFSVLYQVPGVPLLMRIAWPMLILVLGPFGLIVFILSFSGRTRHAMNGKAMWNRPSWNSAMVATSMGIGFAATTMIAIAYLLTLFGLPLFQGLTWPALYLGSPMVLMMIIMYIGAFLVSWLIFHIPMVADMRGVSLKKAAGPAALIVFIAMTSVSAGMMTAVWLYQFWSLPQMQPEDSILWFGLMFMATFIGFLIAYVPNYLLDRKGLKSGAM